MCSGQERTRATSAVSTISTMVPAKSPDQCLPRVRQFASIPRLVAAARTGAQRQEKQKRNRSEFHPLSSSDWSEEVLLQNV
jgi:hypothetical protein